MSRISRRWANGPRKRSRPGRNSVKQSPLPEGRETLVGSVRHRGRSAAMTTATLVAGSHLRRSDSQALDEEMSRDERVFLMGEDIGDLWRGL